MRVPVVALILTLLSLPACGGEAQTDSAAAEGATAIESLTRQETGALAPLPYPLSSPIRDYPLGLRVSNPLAVEVPVTIALQQGRGDGWSMVPESLSLTLAPHASQEIAVQFSHPGTDDVLLVEPQLNFTYNVTDGEGRSTPVTLRRRLGWNREWRLLAQPNAQTVVDGVRGMLEGWEAALTVGLPTWQWSPDETTEEPGKVSVSWHGEDKCYLFLRIPDDDLVDNPDNDSEVPASDAVILRSANVSGEAQRAIAFFPLREGERRALRVVPGQPEKDWPPLSDVEIAARHHNYYPNIQLWEISFPMSAWLGEDWRPGPLQRVNIEVYDADRGARTSVRSWVPRENPLEWAVVGVGPRPHR